MTKRRDLVRLLEQAGYKAERGTNHERFRRADGRSVFVPRHREISYPMSRKILNEAGLSNVRSFHR